LSRLCVGKIPFNNLDHGSGGALSLSFSGRVCPLRDTGSLLARGLTSRF